MSRPSILMHIRQTLGRALRETGQALDRVGIKGQALAVTQKVVGDDPVIYQDHLSRHRHQMPLLRRGRPIVSPDVAFLAPCSTLIGSVRIGPGSSVFYKCVLRADNCLNAKSLYVNDEKDETLTVPWELAADRHRKEDTTSVGGGIFIGSNTNVQDGCIIDSRKDHTRIGDGVTIGHLASIHSATIHDNSLIGMRSLIQEGVVVHEESFVAAGAVVPRNTIIGSGELWVGSPARKLRDLTPTERQKLHYQANEYVKVANSQNSSMELGGNLPESLQKYVMLGSNEDDDASSSFKTTTKEEEEEKNEEQPQEQEALKVGS